MTVGELIEILRTFDGESEILVSTDDVSEHCAQVDYCVTGFFNEATGNFTAEEDVYEYDSDEEDKVLHGDPAVMIFLEGM